MKSIYDALLNYFAIHNKDVLQHEICNDAMSTVDAKATEPKEGQIVREIKYLIIHRISVKGAGYEDNADGIEKFFGSHPDGIRATGGQFPYHVLIEPDGQIVQMEDFAEVTPHAYHFNPHSLGIACVGDFRKSQPKKVQVEALYDLCISLLENFPQAQIVAHDALNGASRDKTKICPGKLLRLDHVIAAVNAYHKMLRGL